MRKKITYLILGIVAVGLCICFAQKQNIEDKTEISEEATTSNEAYFSLIDEGYGTPVKSQTAGTCWVTAASTSMESAYKIQNGTEIEINPLDILEKVHGTDKSEGYFLKDGVNGLELGGWAWQITETLSNGFGEYLLIESEDYSQVEEATFKQKIRETGAMNVAINDAKSSLFGSFEGYQTLNDPDSDDFDHEVTIVGWDDNFPKEYFKQQASKNGAWLCQNTRSDSWGNEGYYWVSYDTPFREQTIFVLTNEYNDVLSYDGGNENCIDIGKSITVANVFSGQGTLRAIGTYTKTANQMIQIKIYDNKFENVIYEQETEIEIPGYHAVYLDENLDVANYAIAINYEFEAPVEGEAWEDDWLSYSVGINEGQSYAFVDGEWLELSDSRTLEKLGLDFTPNNCCIKAIY